MFTISQLLFKWSRALVLESPFLLGEARQFSTIFIVLCRVVYEGWKNGKNKHENYNYTIATLFLYLMLGDMCGLFVINSLEYSSFTVFFDLMVSRTKARGFSYFTV